MKRWKKKQRGDKAPGWKNTGNKHRAKHWEEKKYGEQRGEIEFMIMSDFPFE